MKITLKDIARETGFSISTVSRVISNTGKISEKARGEILNAAKRLKYPGLRIKDGSVRKENLNIALITDFHEGEFYASYFYGFLQAARSEGIRISLLSVADPRREAQKFISALISENYYDGFILFMPELERIDYEKLLKIIPDHFPVVSNSMIENPLFSTITFDGYSGGHQAAALFHESGFRKVAIVNGPSRKAESRFRYNGFRDFISTEPGMELVWKFEGDYEFDSGSRSFEALHKSGVKPDAIFITNDLMATGFIDAASSHGVRIPEDIAVLGYDNLPMCRHSKPEISSVITDFERLGTATMRIIKNRMSQDGPQIGILSLIPVSIARRDSTGHQSSMTEIVRKDDMEHVTESSL